MNATRFLDTNILLYGYDEDAPAKRAIALLLIEYGWNNLGHSAISVQVLQEFHVNLVKQGVPVSKAAQIIQDFAPWPIVDNSAVILFNALKEQSRWRISLWDSLIVAAARFSGATEIYTEDLSHGQNYAGIKAINPFR